METYVTIEELRKEIFEIENVDIDVKQFAHNKRRILNKLRYPEYPYKTKYTGTIDGLLKDRILPIVAKEKIVEE